MSSLMRDALLTLKSMGFNALFREILRRVFGVGYRYRGIPVNSNIAFRVIRNALLRNYNVYSSGSEITIQTPFGEFSVDVADIGLLGVLSESLEDMYGFVDVKDAIVIDIGASIGDTALLFIFKGAYRVYALEPVDKHYHYLLKNISRNKVMDRVIPFNHGVWFRETVLSAGYEGLATGLRTSAETLVTLRVKHIGDILREVFEREGRIDLVKMDCQGCEYSLLNISSEDIKLAKQYIIEIHGSEIPIIDKMSENGYKYRFIKNIDRLVTIYYFTQ
ncbi:MAG: FkbM family methyltransferase [Desulfurococcaceae archaeon]